MKKKYQIKVCEDGVKNSTENEKQIKENIMFKYP